MAKEDIDQIIEKYKSELKSSLEKNPVTDKRVFSKEYRVFKKQYLPKSMTFYEKMCRKAQFLGISPDQKSKEQLEKDIEISHLNVTPRGVYSAAIMYPLLIVIFLGLLSLLLFRTVDPFMILMYLVIFGVLANVLLQVPAGFAGQIRLKASNQMVQAIFYIVSYMRHTSNLELALEFASNRLDPPIALDLKKVLWDVESGKYESVKESLDYYLEGWRHTNIEFVQSMHLIEGSLFESSEDRRTDMLEKALRVMLEETYEKMLHYAHELKGPVNMLYMLGIILPILSLVILPLVGSMMTDENLTPARLSFGIFLLYNLVLPLVVFTQGRMILSKRPTGYGESDISDTNPELRKYKYINILGIKINPLYIAVFLVLLGIVIGMLPLAYRTTIDVQNYNQVIDQVDPEFIENTDFRFWGYKVDDCPTCPEGYLIVGPYGIGSTVLSIIMILLIGVGIGSYYYYRYKVLYNIRENAKKLEKEFSSALFQLGNRLGDGIPAELAFDKAGQVVKGTVSGDFLFMVSVNIRRLGMSVKEAIFNPKRGALVFYPAPIIESSMRVLIESIKKGPIIASQALINISEYIREIHRVNERLRDLLADVISDMKQQISILAPAIAGIVVGITAMIMTILTSLSKLFKEFTGSPDFNPELQAAGSVNVDQLGLINNLFGHGIPTYYFQIIVGLYVLQVTYILTVILNGVENGSDSLFEKYLIGKNLMRTTIIYFIISFTTAVLFSFIAASIIPPLGGM
ncbi:MAG: hypothetical protein ACMXYL_03910 [Candidatus Woesearchaeota archaeon]